MTVLPYRIFNRAVDAGHDYNEADVAGVEGLPSTPGRGSGVMTSSATHLTSAAERWSSGFGMLIQIQTLSGG